MSAPDGSDRAALRRELSQVAVLGASSAATGLLMLVYMTYVARRLGPTAASDFLVALFVVFLFSTMLAPIQGTVVRFGAQYAARGEQARVFALHRWLARRWLVAGGVSLLVALAASQPIARAAGFAGKGPLALTCVAVFMGVLVGLARGVLRSLERFQGFAINTVAEAALRLGGVFVVLPLVATATGALLPLLGGLAAALGLAHLQLVPRRREAPGKDAAFDPGGIVAFTAALFVLALIDGALHNIDILWVKLRWGAHDSGIYGAAAAVTRLFGVIATPLTVLALPTLTIQHEKRQAPGRALARICGYLVVVSAAPLAVLAIWPEAVTDLLFGRDFRAAAPLLFAHGASVVVGYLSVLIGQAFAAIGRFRFLWLAGAGLALEITLLAAWSSSLGQVALAVLAAKLVILAAMATAWMRQPTSS